MSLNVDPDRARTGGRGLRAGRGRRAGQERALLGIVQRRGRAQSCDRGAGGFQAWGASQVSLAGSPATRVVSLPSVWPPFVGSPLRALVQLNPACHTTYTLQQDSRLLRRRLAAVRQARDADGGRTTRSRTIEHWLALDFMDSVRLGARRASGPGRRSSALRRGPASSRRWDRGAPPSRSRASASGPWPAARGDIRWSRAAASRNCCAIMQSSGVPASRAESPRRGRLGHAVVIGQLAQGVGVEATGHRPSASARPADRPDGARTRRRWGRQGHS